MYRVTLQPLVSEGLQRSSEGCWLVAQMSVYIPNTDNLPVRDVEPINAALLLSSHHLQVRYLKIKTHKASVFCPKSCLCVTDFKDETL